MQPISLRIHRRSLGIVLLLVGLLVLASVAGARFSISPQLSITTSEIFYPVQGATADELRHTLNLDGVQTSAGRYDATMNGQLAWHYRYVPLGVGCFLRSIDVEVRLQTTLPAWDQARAELPQLISTWNAYLVALHAHEAGHQARALAAGYDILQHISTQRLYRSCPELVQHITAEANQILRQSQSEQLRYDEVTGHGRLQGAYFP